jgi:glycosyltransferase involved in cell wall biosynthesis
MMKVAIITRSDESAGGASRSAHLLANGLRSLGCLVDEWIVFPRNKYSYEYKLVYSGHLASFIPYTSYIISRIIGLPDLLGIDIIKITRLVRSQCYDIVHFHDVVMSISPLTMYRVAKNTPVLQTLHDCSTFTAGCIYPDMCNNFSKACGNCPQLRSWPMDSLGPDFTKVLHYIKKRIHNNSSIELIAPSDWIRQLASRSSVLATRPHLIPYGVDTDLIRPIDRAIVRNVLALPTDKKIVTFAATHVDDPRKGYRFALEAIKQLSIPREQLVFLAIGHPPRTPSSWIVEDLDCRFVGFIQDMRLMMQYFAASDVFLFPTLNDNLPLVVLESMASGTPAVAFRTGGVPEMVDHEITGYIADQGDVNGLVEGLREALIFGKAKDWGAAARRKAEDRYSLRQHALAHLELYERLIAQEKSK